MGNVIKMRKEAVAAIEAHRLDGWKNILTGIGIKGKDRRRSTHIVWERMHEQDAEELYSASDIAGKVVDEVVNDSFREGYELQADGIKPDLLKNITGEGDRLQVDQKLAEAWRLARMYGGSAIVLMPRDIKMLARPFIAEAMPEILSLLVLSNWELPRQFIEYDVRNPNFGYPQTYRITPRQGAGEKNSADQMNVEVHHSWLIRFDGSFLPRVLFLKNNHWHDSVLNKAKDVIRDYDAAMNSVSATLDDFSIAVMKIKGLTASISEDRDDLIVKRLEIANLSRSIAKTIILDADSEEYTYQDRQLTGVADCVKLIAGRLVVASNMPHTKILGESPSGSNATGNSTTKDWYDHVRAQQENYLDPKLIELWKRILLAKKSPTGGKLPKNLEAVYAPLWQEPESVQATMRYNQAQADSLYIGDGVLAPAEVAISRFGTGKYSTTIKLQSTSPKDRGAIAEEADPADPQENDGDPAAGKNKPETKKPLPGKPKPGSKK